jgi:hypothetical protein
MRWETQIKNPSHENFSQLIVVDFSMVRMGPYSYKSIEGAIWTIFQFFPSQENVSTKSTWGIINTPITPWHMVD